MDVRDRRGDRVPHPSSVPADLHDSVVQGDRVPVNRLAAYLLTLLPGFLRRNFPRAPRDWIVDAATDAIVEYIVHPNRFDGTRGIPLERFLCAAASNDLRNRLSAERHRLTRDANYAAEMKRRVFGKHDAYEGRCGGIRHIVGLIPNSVDRRFILAWLYGDELSTTDAEALGLAGLSITERRRVMKQIRERIVKRVRRHLRQPSPNV